MAETLIPVARESIGSESCERMLAFSSMRAALLTSYGLFGAGLIMTFLSLPSAWSRITIFLGVVSLLVAPVLRLARLAWRWSTLPGARLLVFPALFSLVMYAFNVVFKLILSP